MKKEKANPAVAKKSYKDGHVSVGFTLKARDRHGGGSVKAEANTDITTAQARELAAALIEQADKADAKVSAKVAHEERRRKYREREIAAGRMIVFNGIR